MFSFTALLIIILPIIIIISFVTASPAPPPYYGIWKDPATAISSSREFNTGILDVTNHFMYLTGMLSSQVKICKFDVGLAQPVFSGCIAFGSTAPTSTTLPDFGIFDDVNYMAVYFYAANSGYAKVTMSPSSLVFLAFVSNGAYTAGYIVGGSSVGFFGYDKIYWFQLQHNQYADTMLSAVSTSATVTRHYCFVRDTVNSITYWGTDSGEVVKILTPCCAYPSYVSAVGDAGVTDYRAAAIDQPNLLAYFATGSSNKVCKYGINPGLFTFFSCANTGSTVPGRANFRYGFQDVTGKLFYVLASNGSSICIFNVESLAFGYVGCYDNITPQEGLLKSIQFDQTTYAAYAGTSGSANPGYLLKIWFPGGMTQAPTNTTTSTTTLLSTSTSTTSTTTTTKTPTTSTTTSTTTTSTSSATIPSPPTTTTTTMTTTQPPPVISTLAPVQQFSTIPPNLTEFPSNTQPSSTSADPAQPPPPPAPTAMYHLQQISNQDQMSEIISILNTFTTPPIVPPVEVTLRAADSSLGAFIVKAALLPPSVTISVGTRNEYITFATTANTNDLPAAQHGPVLAQVLRNCYVFSASPEAQQRNLTRFRYILVSARDSSASGNQTGATSVAMTELILNQGPQVNSEYSSSLSSRVQFNITRGNKFLLELGNVFFHPQHLPMLFVSHLDDYFPLPTTIRLNCDSFSGNCSVRGILDSEGTLGVQIDASDQYMMRSCIFNLNVISVPIHPNDAALESFVPVRLRPGVNFQYSIPLNLFISSTTITYTGVRAADGFPLPPTMSFDAPNTLRGYFSQSGTFRIQVRASDLFFDSYVNLTLNFTNQVPFCRNDFTTYSEEEIQNMTSSSSTTETNSSSFTNNIPPIYALQPFDRSIDFSRACSDADSDPIQFIIHDYDVPTWLHFSVRPGGLTTIPQTLLLSGIAPKSTQNTVINISVTVSDSFSQTTFVVPFRILPNIGPQLIRPLPSFTMSPGESQAWDINLNDYFVDPSGDELLVSTKFLTEYAKSWLQVTVDEKKILYLVANPPDQAPDDQVGSVGSGVVDTEDKLEVRVSDPFGNSTSSVITIEVIPTAWQRIRTLVIIISTIIGLLISVISGIFMLPFFLNVARVSKRTIPCPLSAQNPRYELPQRAATVELMDRSVDAICMSFRNFTKRFSIFVYDELTLQPFPLDEPPEFLMKVDNALLLNIQPKEGTTDVVDPFPVYTHCYVRVFDRHRILLEQFYCDYHQVTQGWVFTSASVSNHNNYINSLPLAQQPPRSRLQSLAPSHQHLQQQQQQQQAMSDEERKKLMTELKDVTDAEMKKIRSDSAQQQKQLEDENARLKSRIDSMDAVLQNLMTSNNNTKNTPSTVSRNRGSSIVNNTVATSISGPPPSQQYSIVNGGSSSSSPETSANNFFAATNTATTTTTPAAKRERRKSDGFVNKVSSFNQTLLDADDEMMLNQHLKMFHEEEEEQRQKNTSSSLYSPPTTFTSSNNNKLQIRASTSMKPTRNEETFDADDYFQSLGDDEPLLGTSSSNKSTRKHQRTFSAVDDLEAPIDL